MYQKQKGASMWQWLFVGGMVGIFVYIGLMLTPVYMESMSVSKAIRNIEDFSGARLSKDEVRRKIMAQFQIDQVTRVAKDDIKFKTQRNGKMEVSIDYEVRVHLASNLYILVEFKNKAIY